MKTESKLFVKMTAAIAACFLLVSLAFPVGAAAAGNYNGLYLNRDTNYVAYVLDGADYLTYEEENQLIEDMIPLTEYTNVVYVTDDNNIHYSESYSESFATNCAETLFDNESAIVYLCDNEYDYIIVQGDIKKFISNGQCRSITDNVYSYSADEEYYKAARKAFSQALDLIEGRKIAEPMKYICNAFIGLFVAFLICYSIISGKSKLKRATNSEMLEGAINWIELGQPDVQFVNTTRTYSPQSSSSGGSRGGGHHGGGHHGGGHHGGGHSH